MKGSSRALGTAFQSLFKQGSNAATISTRSRVVPVAFTQSLTSASSSANGMVVRRDYGSSSVVNAVSGQDILASFGNNDFEGKSVASAMEALANADAVCFDVDSTVIQEEGIVSDSER